MSDREKKALIFKWLKETESLKTLLMVFTLLCLLNGCRPSSAEPPASLNGRWVGSIVFRGRTDRMIMDFYGASGEWQGFVGKPGLPDYLFVPVVNVRYQDPRLSFEIRDGAERLFFAGMIAGDSFKGGARVGEQEMALDLRRTGAAAPRTSQPVTEEAIQFRNGEASFAGALLLPSGPGPHPAIVLIHGSGRQSRDEWRIIGMLFARHGVAALLYDKRDVGHEPSGMDLVDLRDLAGDALAAVALLKARNDIRDDQIGLWGISQGGMVAPIAAAQSRDVAFVIAVSAPGVSYAELYQFAVSNALRSRGFSDRKVLEAIDALRRLDNFVRKRNPQGARPMLEEARRKPWFEFSTLPPAPPAETELRTWVRWRNLDLDPARHWERVKVPALLIYGEREDRMPVDKCVERIREALRRAGNSRNMIKVVPGADHELMLALNYGAKEKRSVEVSEERRVAPDYLDTMTGWLREQLALAR
jgi:pimeloyl-ACP methyl ester carboxylesterase